MNGEFLRRTHNTSSFWPTKVTKVSFQWVGTSSCLFTLKSVSSADLLAAMSQANAPAPRRLLRGRQQRQRQPGWGQGGWKWTEDILVAIVWHHYGCGKLPVCKGKWSSKGSCMVVPSTSMILSGGSAISFPCLHTCSIWFYRSLFTPPETNSKPMQKHPFSPAVVSSNSSSQQVPIVFLDRVGPDVLMHVYWVYHQSILLAGPSGWWWLSCRPCSKKLMLSFTDCYWLYQIIDCVTWVVVMVLTWNKASAEWEGKKPWPTMTNELVCHISWGLTVWPALKPMSLKPKQKNHRRFSSTSKSAFSL